MKKIFKKLFSGWMIFARFLGRINAFILLNLLYFVIIGPVAIFLKLIRKDLLDTKFPDSKKSFWIRKDRKVLQKKDYEQQF